MLNQFKLISLALAVSAIVGCASGGGAGGVVQTSTTPPPSGGTTNTTTDKRIAFDSFEQSYESVYGPTTVIYEMAPHTTTGLPAPTEKYKIADYGFLRIRVEGSHNGSDEGSESNAPGAWAPSGYWFEADLNGDQHSDLYFIGHYEGAIDWMPGARLLAFINDGEGHFRLAPEVFENNEFPCIAGEGPLWDKTDPNHSCGFQRGNNYPLVNDFNGDGITDLFTVGSLFLSDNGVIKNVSHSNLPDIFFQEHIGPLFSHRVDEGDADGDGDLDIFMPVFGTTKVGYRLDGSLDNCSGCNTELPWMMLINDGTGNFTLNTNFNAPTVYTHNGETNRIWATSTVLNDFNSDGHGDVAVGWENPSYAEHYGWLQNSAGNVYLNNGNNDWRTDPINLPESWFGANGIAVDMDSFDFNNDGFNDIIISTTKRSPEYQGNVIQFLLNDGTGHFSDVTATFNPSYEKYQDGSGTNWQNGGGLMHILDFDHDGDLDVVSTNGRSYVLLNENGSFKLYDDFPIFDNGDGGNLWPVEIDGKWWYDFIGLREVRVDNDTGYIDFFQVLDPPAMANVMNIDLYSKPNAYRNLAQIANNVYNDLFYFTRYNTSDLQLIGINGDYINQFGFSVYGDNFGFAYIDGNGSQAVSSHQFDYNTDSFLIYSIKDISDSFKLYAGLGYSKTDFDNQVTTYSFGSGNSVTNADTIGLELSMQWLWSDFDFALGVRQNDTNIDGFTDVNDTLELQYNDQSYDTTILVSQLGYNKLIKNFYIGFDVEYLNYLSGTESVVNFSQGGNYISTNELDFNDSQMFSTIKTGLVFDNFAVILRYTDNNDYKETSLSFNINF